MDTRRSLRRFVSVLFLVTLLSVAVAAPVSAATTLRSGSRGAEVVRLQKKLSWLRYDVGAIDGVFGGDTKHAVVAFQKVNRLAPDGIVGPRTRAALANPVRPRLRHVRAGTYVEVNLTRQVLLLARAGTVVRIFDTSTGKAATPTPRGSFRLQRRINGWRTSRLGQLWRPYYFYGGYAIHGSTSVPAYPASHGCVRLTIRSMNRIWPRLAIGMPVYVYR